MHTLKLSPKSMTIHFKRTKLDKEILTEYISKYKKRKLTEL